MKVHGFVCVLLHTVGLVCYVLFLVMRLCEFYQKRTITNRTNLHAHYIACAIRRQLAGRAPRTRVECQCMQLLISGVELASDLTVNEEYF